MLPADVDVPVPTCVDDVPSDVNVWYRCQYCPPYHINQTMLGRTDTEEKPTLTNNNDQLLIIH